MYSNKKYFYQLSNRYFPVTFLYNYATKSIFTPRTIFIIKHCKINCFVNHPLIV